MHHSRWQWPCLGTSVVVLLLCTLLVLETRCCCDGILLSPCMLGFLRSFVRGPDPSTPFPSCDDQSFLLHAKPHQIVLNASDPTPLPCVHLFIVPSYRQFSKHDVLRQSSGPHVCDKASELNSPFPHLCLDVFAVTMVMQRSGFCSINLIGPNQSE